MSDIYLGDCREVRSALPDNSVDTIITDPPYGLEFMGKGWDKGVPGVEFWKEFLAVAKPGAMLLAFGGTRTFHRMTAAIEDSGWEIRDCMMWLYGSGFPKSLNISKAIDKAKGVERDVVGISANDRPASQVKGGKAFDRGLDEGQEHQPLMITAPATDLAKQWDGWGTALKPAWEPIIVAMKPLDGTFAENAEKWGVAGINVDGGRISTSEKLSIGSGDLGYHGADGSNPGKQNAQGRWPANLLLDEDAAAMLDGRSGTLKSHGGGTASYGGAFGNGKAVTDSTAMERFKGDSGGASRFFYVAKASRTERNRGCEGLPQRPSGMVSENSGQHITRRDGDAPEPSANHHPTVKPLKLMEYLCTLTKTPTGGIVLDPFAGSGTTLLAAKNTGREYIGIEQNPEYFEIIKARLGV